MAQALHSIDADMAGRSRAAPTAARAAAGHPAGIRQPARYPAGPFEVVPRDEKDGAVREAVVTGLLVVYPAFATVAAIVAALMLTGGGA